MRQLPDRWTDEQVETKISHLLRWGVILSAAVVLLGGSIYLTHDSNQSLSDHLFRGEPASLRLFSGILHGVLMLQGRSIIQLGILLLILTPTARVAFSVFAFWQQRDRPYVIVTLIVLTVLIHGLLPLE